ncbi:putative membrane protein [Methylopila capsulata]|uniref:DUF350 domain-containing protein n=1 Tax=Methylopila capsulata TaxID=61654 RepID=A0A9W6IVL8_9HYPH|nr:DUF350 domain-containing protein [Methylopila capsulata]MBM7850648.1 putative membrane protein [Methylopila capsulata]GLK55941.1 DUF350 domain-containing protein [Methylopila capsulata]
MDDATLIDRPNALVVARHYLSGFPEFAAYFALAIVLAGLFLMAYSRITPHHEFRLVRAGNMAAVPALLGALLGFALPMKAAMGGAASLADFALWSVIAAVVQIGAYGAARAVMPDVSIRISNGEMAAGAWLGGVSVVVGVLNAAAMTY